MSLTLMINITIIPIMRGRAIVYRTICRKRSSNGVAIPTDQSSRKITIVKDRAVIIPPKNAVSKMVLVIFMGSSFGYRI